MTFAGVNYLAILFAGAAGFAFGAGYYMTLGKVWMHALGKTKEDIEREKSPVPFVFAVLAQFVIAIMIAGMLGHIAEYDMNAPNGVLTALTIWFGFVVTTMTVNYSFQGARPMLTLIDAGHWLGVFLIQGLIIGAMGA